MALMVRNLKVLLTQRYLYSISRAYEQTHKRIKVNKHLICRGSLEVPASCYTHKLLVAILSLF
jgi:hypothetical protein